ncbi:MAG: peptide chain release factor N(5)-glutamine methyltransferase [Bacillota bacterium]|nr:peptide chain release factor N(5)-glutamine methyltransferase [Bacillota bacterium]
MVVKSLNDIYLDLRSELKKENRMQAEMIAREICSFGASIQKDAFEASKNLFLSEESITSIYALFERFRNDEPLPYIIGEWEFYSLTFKTPPGVLIPRADTETLVAAALKATDKDPPSRVLDLCCGTGCVGIAYIKNRPGVKAVLADISPAAIRAAKDNIELHNLSGSVYALYLDVLKGSDPVYGKFDLILSNPPYIRTDEITTLDRSVRDFEPHTALDGGGDGFLFYRAIADKWKTSLNPGGQLFVECGINQSDEVKSILKHENFKTIRVYKDLSGIPRVVSGRI